MRVITATLPRVPTAPLDGPRDLLGPSIRQLLEHGQPLVIEERQVDIWV